MTNLNESKLYPILEQYYLMDDKQFYLIAIPAMIIFFTVIGLLFLLLHPGGYTSNEAMTVVKNWDRSYNMVTELRNSMTAFLHKYATGETTNRYLPFTKKGTHAMVPWVIFMKHSVVFVYAADARGTLRVNSANNGFDVLTKYNHICDVAPAIDNASEINESYAHSLFSTIEKKEWREKMFYSVILYNDKYIKPQRKTMTIPSKWGGNGTYYAVSSQKEFMDLLLAKDYENKSNGCFGLTKEQIATMMDKMF